MNGLVSSFSSAFAGIVFVLLAFNLVCAFFSLWLAKQKGYSDIGWFFLSLVFGSISLISLVGAPNKKA
jgi:hypothetical protein